MDIIRRLSPSFRDEMNSTDLDLCRYWHGERPPDCDQQPGADTGTGAVTDLGQQRYSPSSPSTEEPMDWTANLGGVRELLSGSGGKLTEDPTGKVASKADSTPEGCNAARSAPLPVPPPSTSGQGGPSGISGDSSSNNKRANSGNNNSAKGSDATTGSASDPDADAGSQVAAKRKEFLRANYQKKTVEILNSFGREILTYNVIRKHNATKHNMKDLATGAEVTAADTGTLLFTVDGRMRLVEKDINLGQKQTWSLSFNLRNMECIGCAAHTNWQPFPQRGSNS
jgi:hypothetical protein